jgi:hypothetical protein
MDVTFLIPILKVLAALGLMLVFLRLKLGIGMSILLGSLGMALFFGHGPVQWTRMGLTSLMDTQLVLLLIIIDLIMVLSQLLESTGQSQRLMKQLSIALRWEKLRLAFFPALIGLLPMPGGAVFSAPMVKNATEQTAHSGERLALINYWFRHVWEMIWPLYPGIILAASLSGVSLFRLISFTWPSTLILLALGWFFYLSRLPGPKFDGGRASKPAFDKGETLRQGSPLIIAVLGTLGLEMLIWLLQLPIPSETGFIAALALAVAGCLLQNRDAVKGWGSLFVKPHVLSMLGTLAAIFVFKGVLDQGGVVQELSQGAGSRATLLAITCSLPFLVGCISGITMAFVGSTFPLIHGIMAQLSIESTIPYVVLALFSGFAGVMASPLHICFVLTCEYFQTSLIRTWLKLLAPTALFLVSGVVYFFALTGL